MDTRAQAEPATTNEPATPRPALLLGWAGVLPFAALSAALLAGFEPAREFAGRALPAYAAVILGFMGGVQWGLEMSRAAPARPGKDASWRGGYIVSVLPALLAAGTLLLAPQGALLLLAAGFAALLMYDLMRARAGVGPGWYPRLRIALTCAVLVSLTAAIYALHAG
jgi:hypothetical protein